MHQRNSKHSGSPLWVVCNPLPFAKELFNPKAVSVLLLFYSKNTFKNKTDIYSKLSEKHGQTEEKCNNKKFFFAPFFLNGLK